MIEGGARSVFFAVVGSIMIRCADKKLVMIQEDINDQQGGIYVHPRSLQT